MKKLSTTSYAILALLALRPWSAYELTREMHRSAGAFWPRAARGVFDEPRNLVAHGFATAEAEMVGARPRTVYAITPEGRGALRAWLATPLSAPNQLESEALLRVAFAENGELDDLRATLAAFRTQILDHLEFRVEVLREYAEGRGRYPDRLHVNSLMTRYFADLYEMSLAWIDWASEEIDGWEDCAKPTDREAALAIFAEAAERLADLR